MCRYFCSPNCSSPLADSTNSFLDWRGANWMLLHRWPRPYYVQNHTKKVTNVGFAACGGIKIQWNSKKFKHVWRALLDAAEPTPNQTASFITPTHLQAFGDCILPEVVRIRLGQPEIYFDVGELSVVYHLHTDKKAKIKARKRVCPMKRKGFQAR